MPSKMLPYKAPKSSTTDEDKPANNAYYIDVIPVFLFLRLGNISAENSQAFISSLNVSLSRYVEAVWIESQTEQVRDTASQQND